MNATPSKKRQNLTSSCLRDISNTPSKRSKSAHPLHPSSIDPYDAPNAILPSPTAPRTSIGPTPQKNGTVLGLFDSISPVPHDKTPPEPCHSLLAMKDNVQVTPSKRQVLQYEEHLVALSGKNYHGSPLGVTKQAYPNTYLTPSADRILKIHDLPDSSRAIPNPRSDDTPSFLRRENQRVLFGKENTGTEQDDSWSPVARRRTSNTYASKGLSALLKGIRDMEEDKLDEELDLLKELEGDNNPLGKTKQSTKVLIQASQWPEMPLGPDCSFSSKDDEILLDGGEMRTTEAMKVWKKKGQKRTTRKVVMKPNTYKWKPDPVWKVECGDGEDGGEGEEKEEVLVVRDTQHIEKRALQGKKLEENPRTQKAKGLIDGSIKRVESSKSGRSDKVKKKVSATSHANFRALKIRNKQSKANRGRKFGR